MVVNRVQMFVLRSYNEPESYPLLIRTGLEIENKVYEVCETIKDVGELVPVFFKLYLCFQLKVYTDIEYLKHLLT